MFRPLVMGRRCIVTSAHPLASMAGLKVLKDGGNAFDAAVTVSAVLSVVLPYLCGIGGDIFFLAFSAGQKEVVFLNGSGRSPQKAHIENFKEQGYNHIPLRGPLSVNVPGCVSGWDQIYNRFGTLNLEDLLKPAIEYARDGFPISFKGSQLLGDLREVIVQDEYLCKTFMLKGKRVQAGDIIVQESLANTLQAIAQKGCGVFYGGDIAERIDEYMSKNSGFLTLTDMQEHTANWSEPLCTTYEGYSIFQTPPNTQGMAALLAFNILEELNLSAQKGDYPFSIHNLVEAKKIAYFYGQQYITDPDFVPVEFDDILDKQYGARLSKAINPRRASSSGQGRGPWGDSVFFSIADQEGNIVAGSQSLNSVLGAGCSVVQTGIILQNGGSLFSLDPCHINRLEPRKRPFHPLTASIITNKNSPIVVMGSSGCDIQPQVHLQVITKLLQGDYNLQEAIEAPRWIHGPKGQGFNSSCLQMEGRYPAEVIGTLEAWGHNIQILDEWSGEVGEAQGIMIDGKRGIYAGGCDPRGESYAAVW